VSGLVLSGDKGKIARIEIRVDSSDALTMDSREIAELCEKDHAHVCRDIRDMVAGLNIDDPKMDHQLPEGITVDMDARGYVTLYHLDRTMTLTLITGYRVDIRAKVVARWLELERAAFAPSLPNFTDPVAAARAWADEVEAKQKAQAELVIAAPKVESFDALMRSEQTMSITDAAKHFGLHPKAEVFPYLRESGYLTSKDLPTQAAIDAGYLALRETKCADNEVRRQSVVLASQLDTWRVRVVPQIRAWMGEGRVRVSPGMGVLCVVI